MPSSAPSEQEFVAHLFAPLSGPDLATAYQQITTVWRRCRDELAMTCAIPNTGLPTELPMHPPATSAAEPICGIQDRQSDYQAVLRHEHDVLNLSLVFTSPLAAPSRRARIGNASPPGWPEFARWWRRLAGGGTEALLGVVTVFQAKAMAAGVGSPDLTACGADAWAALPPSSSDAEGWWRRGHRVGDGLVLWETSARHDDRAERRLVVLADPDQDAVLSAFTWSDGRADLPPLGRYLMHAAKLRYEARVLQGDATALNQLRDRVKHRAEQISADLARVAPGPGDLAWDRSVEVAALAADEALLAGTLGRLEAMRQSVKIALGNLRSVGPEPLASDANLGCWLSQQLADDKVFLDAARKHAKRVRRITRDLGIGASASSSRQLPSLLSPPAAKPTPVAAEPVAPRVVFGVDVADFSRWSKRRRQDAQQRVAALVEQVLGDAGVRLRDADRQDTGDGLVVVLPAGVRPHLAIPRLLLGWQKRLGADSEQHRDRDRLRARVAMSIGESVHSAIGVDDATVGEIDRLLGSPVLRDALAGEPGTDLAVLVTDRLHHEVTNRSPTRAVLPAEAFEKHIVSAADGRLLPAWFWTGNDDPLPGSATDPKSRAPRARLANPGGNPMESDDRGRRVLVIGRLDDQVTSRFRRFLRSLGLRPVELPECIDATERIAPSTMDIVQAGLRLAQATVVLLTPAPDHPPAEAAGDGGQRRPADAEVLLQAGLALGSAPDQTLLVTVGPVELPAQLHDYGHISLDDRPETRQSIASRLRNAGCDVDQTGTDWLASGVFSGLSAYHRTAEQEPEGNMPNARDVFVIHGRDDRARAALWGFLQAIDLHPLDWEEIVTRTKSSMPSLIQVLHKAFEDNQAAVVLMTPDDGACLHPSLHGPHEPAHETQLTGQGRPNVLFEAGMALALQPDRTLIVEVGQVRPFSDVGGLNVVKLDGTVQALQKIANRLENAGCAVNTKGTDWLDVTRFAGLDAYTRRF